MQPELPNHRPLPDRRRHLADPNPMPAGPQAYPGTNSMLIRGEQTVVVDTGAPVHPRALVPAGAVPGRTRRRPLDLHLARRQRAMPKTERPRWC